MGDSTTPHARIPLRNRAGDTVAWAAVDHGDLVELSSWRWALGNHGYAFRGWRLNGRKGVTLMHRQLLGLEHGDRRQVDHVNGDRLDNRRGNLRIVTVAQQRQNQLRTDGTSRHRGVHYDRQTGRWRAAVSIGPAGSRVRHSLGRFDSEEAAAAAAEAFRREHMPFSVTARASRDV